MNIDVILNIAIIAMCVVLLLILYKDNKKEVVKKIILALVVQAEKNLGSKTGDLKYAEVMKGLYGALPSIVRILFTEEDIDNYIEDGVQKLKEMLNNGVDLNGYEIENTNNTEVKLIEDNGEKE